MYTNLTVLLSVFLLVNGLDLECSVDTIERLFAASSDEKCELCEILKSKLDITHCQSNLLPSPCFSSTHHHLPQQFSLKNTTQLQHSIHWDKTIATTNNNVEQPVFHVFIRRLLIHTIVSINPFFIYPTRYQISHPFSSLYIFVLSPGVMMKNNKSTFTSLSTPTLRYYPKSASRESTLYGVLLGIYVLQMQR